MHPDLGRWICMVLDLKRLAYSRILSLLVLSSYIVGYVLREALVLVTLVFEKLTL